MDFICSLNIQTAPDNYTLLWFGPSRVNTLIGSVYTCLSNAIIIIPQRASISSFFPITQGIYKEMLFKKPQTDCLADPHSPTQQTFESKEAKRAWKPLVKGVPPC